MPAHFRCHLQDFKREGGVRLDFMSLAGYDRTTMARRARIEFSGALYHVIIRGGDRQQDIFGDDRDWHFWSWFAATESSTDFFYITFGTNPMVMGSRK